MMKPVKLLNLDPVTFATTPEELAYMRQYLREDTVLDSKSIASGPASIEHACDEAMALPQILRACVQAEADGYQGVFVNCFADPGVAAAREVVRIPVFGGFEPALHLALGTAHKIGIVTVMPSVLTMLEDLIAKTGLSHRVACLRCVDIPVLELSDDARLARALKEESIRAITQQGAQAIVLGCTAMVGVAEALQADLIAAGHPAPVLEAARCGVTLLELYARMGLAHSPLTYIPATLQN